MSVKLAVAVRHTAAAAAAAAVRGGTLDCSAGLDFNFLSLGSSEYGGTEGAERGWRLRHKSDWIRLCGRGVQCCRRVTGITGRALISKRCPKFCCLKKGETKQLLAQHVE